jgi:GLPGLI family protein
MKQPAILLILAMLSLSLKAQDSVFTVKYAVNKNWVKMIEGVEYITPQQKERAKYMYGNRSSYTSYTRLYFNDTLSLYSDVLEDEESYGYSWLREPYIIRRDFREYRSHDVMTWLRKVMIVEDTLVLPRWKILNDIREIAGHICMNATYTDTVKGQTFVAWFALDIPSPAGPERLCGLPGLILGVDVNNGAMEIMAQSIETVPLTDQLTKPTRFDGRKIKGKHVSEAEYQSKVKQFMDEKRKAMEYPFWGVRY